MTWSRIVLAALASAAVTALLGATMLPTGADAAQSSPSSIRFPDADSVLNVTKAPFFAKGDGKTDDTEAIQKAVSAMMGRHQVLYFPAGTYVIGKTIQWSNRNSAGETAWGKNWLQGEDARTTVIRLKDGVFPHPKQPAAMMWCGGFGSADWFHNYVQDLTFDVGANNPGAIGLQFYSNNSGAVRNCRFVAPAGSGIVGLDLAHRDMNGPLLVSRCEVEGFRRGVSSARAVNGQTFEHLTLRGQSEIGFTNEGQAISIRGLTYEGPAPAISTYGTLALIEAELKGTGGAAALPAIVNYNGGRLFVRDARTSGFGRAIGDVVTPDSAQAYRIQGEDKPGSLGPNVAEYSSHPAVTLFGKGGGSLRLPIRETPASPVEPTSRWAVVDRYGADPTGTKDSSDAIQAALDSGARTVFFPGKHYLLTRPVIVRGKVRRLLGVGTMIDYEGKTRPNFRIIDDGAPALHFEHFSHVGGGVEVDTRRTVVFRSVSDCDLTFTPNAEAGELFLEDFVTHDLRLRKRRTWARQLNIENEGRHLLNDGSDLWILGYKTERGGTLAETRGGGRTEILGGFSYTTTAGKLAPMFVDEEASLFTFFTEVCFNGDPFQLLVRETRNGVTQEIARGAGHTAPYNGSR